jgi:hypothetical protein
VPCHVVEIEGRNGNTKIWTAHDKGFLPLKFEYTSTHPVRGDLFEQRVVQEIALAETDMGAFWYPTKARWVLRERNGQESTNEINVSAFVPNAPVTKEAFRVDFPPGTRVLDLIAGVQYRVGDLQDVNVSELWQTTAQGTDVNQGGGGTDAVLSSSTASVEDPAIVAMAEQNDRNRLATRGTSVAQAAPGTGIRRTLCVVFTGLGAALLLVGILSLRASRRGLAQSGR